MIFNREIGYNLVSRTSAVAILEYGNEVSVYTIEGVGRRKEKEAKKTHFDPKNGKIGPFVRLRQVGVIIPTFRIQSNH